MKESFYNIYAKQPYGWTICYNTRFSSFALLPKLVYKLITSGNIDKIPPQYIAPLEACGCLLNDNIDEFQQLLEEHEKVVSADNSNFELTLLPSLDCNLRCWYCFENHVKGSHLSSQTINNILKLIHNICNNKKIDHINIELFGGEPLLYFEEELYPLLKDIENIAGTSHKSVSFFFVTNATCITEDMIPLFANLKAKFQISIDGYKDKHNKVKKDIRRKDEPTYQRVMEIIRMLTKSYPECYINLRINYDNKTLIHITELLQDIEDIDPSQLGFHLERVWQTKADTNVTMSVKDAILMILRSGYTVSYMNFSRRSCSCKTSRINQAVISYDGKVYKCSGRDFTNELQEGKLTDEGTIEWQEEKLQKRLNIITFSDPRCKKCKMLPLCWGPCNQKLLEHPDRHESYCQLNNLEISLEDYIFVEFNNELLKRKIYQTTE
ncbi:MAG: radical SAM protein [Bacteroidaceae bacterium]|nr:radical SAM protein [Bacteroidaceae bacterium]